MILHTASEVISLEKRLENDSSEFYRALAGSYEKAADTFLSFAVENGKNVKQAERAYYGTISDALEGGFAFKIEEEKYSIKTDLPNGPDYPASLRQALEVERTIIAFYTDAAGQSQSLMGDVPRIFRLLARKRAERLEKLESLLSSASEGSV